MRGRAREIFSSRSLTVFFPHRSIPPLLSPPLSVVNFSRLSLHSIVHLLRDSYETRERFFNTITRFLDGGEKRRGAFRACDSSDVLVKRERLRDERSEVG